MDCLRPFEQRHPNVAYLYAILGHSLFSILQICFKYLTAVVSPLHILFMRACTLTSLNLLLFQKTALSPYLSSPLLFRTVMMRMACTSGASAILHFCVKYLPVSTTSTLFNMSPIFVFFIEAVYSKKPFSKVSFVLTLVSFSGVILIIQPELLFGAKQNNKQEGFEAMVALMLLSAMLVAMGFIFIHDTAKKVNIMVNLHYSYQGHMLFSALFSQTHPPHIDWSNFTWFYLLMFILIVATGFMSQFLVYSSNCLMRPSKVMPFAYAGIMTGFVGDVWLFGTTFSTIEFIGMALTSCGLLGKWLSEKEQQTRQPEQGHN